MAEALRCKNCGHAFEGEPSDRCPKCLRLTSVVRAGGSDARREEAGGEEAGARAAGGAASWPAGTACPLCLAEAVAADPGVVVHFVFVGASSRVRLEAGHRGVAVRARACVSCRQRVVARDRTRWAALPFALLGLFAWPAALVSSEPLASAWHVDAVSAIALATLACVLVTGVPLFLVDHANRATRRALEVSWLFRRVRASIEEDAPSGPPERWRLTARVPADAKPISAEELVG